MSYNEKLSNLMDIVARYDAEREARQQEIGFLTKQISEIRTELARLNEEYRQAVAERRDRAEIDEISDKIDELEGNLRRRNRELQTVEETEIDTVIDRDELMKVIVDLNNTFREEIQAVQETKILEAKKAYQEAIQELEIAIDTHNRDIESAGKFFKDSNGRNIRWVPLVRGIDGKVFINREHREEHR